MNTNVISVDKWPSRFLRMAREVAGWSKDPSTQVGAVIVRPDRTIASLGYNGFPRGVSDDPEIYAKREDKYARVVHAELNAILNAREPVAGYTLYVYPFQPCSNCMAAIIQSGIKRVVTVRPDPVKAERWAKDFETAGKLAREAGVAMDIHHAANIESNQ